MPLGIYPRTKEQYEKIGKINSIKMKEYWRNNKATQKQIDAITKTSIRKKESFGYVNSSEARKKLSQTWKKKWANGEVSQKQKDNFLIKCRGVRKGMKDSEQHKLNIGIKNKEHRKNQIFPKQDTSIEIKIQDYLKQLGFNFFTHQHMNIEHGYQCDILILDLNMVIECDGDYWHKYPIGSEIDKIRTSELLSQGFQVLRMWEHEIKVMDLERFKRVIKGGLF